MSDQPNAADVAPAPVLNVTAEANPAEAVPSKDAVTPEAHNDDSTNEEKAKAEEKPRQRASERISELYGRMKAAERQRDMAIAEVERLRQPSVSPEEFQQLSFDEQQRFNVRDAVRAERAAELALSARHQHEEAAHLLAQQFYERVAAAKSQIPDIEASLSDPTLPITATTARVLCESEKGPQLAYWLSKNRQEAERISQMSAQAQAYELGRIEARLDVSSSARKVSKAPNPVNTVGGGAGTGAKDPGAMSMSEYIAWRKAGA